jgi:hypothetical protein
MGVLVKLLLIIYFSQDSDSFMILLITLMRNKDNIRGMTCFNSVNLTKNLIIHVPIF